MASKQARKEVSKQQPQRRRQNRNQGFKASWGDADAKRVLRAIDAVTRTGAAIRFGYTRDQGVYAIGFVGDGEPHTEYVRPDEDLELYLDGVIADFESPPG